MMNGKINIDELVERVTSSVCEALGRNIVREGVRYDDISDSFSFNFNKDGQTDIISLTKKAYKVSAFNHCYYYAYEFGKDVESSRRTAFINSVKFPDGRISEKDKNTFLVNAVDKLDSEISLPSYKLIVYPESMSEINRKMLSYLTRFSSPDIATMELVKKLPSNIEFDYQRFKMEVLDAKLPNGRGRYTKKQKEETLWSIEKIMEGIRWLDYFSVARNMRKSKWRQYLKSYYSFKNDEDRKLFENISSTNVLIIDDVVTSGTTLSNILSCLRSVNDKNNIVVFSLIGKELIEKNL